MNWEDLIRLDHNPSVPLVAEFGSLKTPTLYVSPVTHGILHDLDPVLLDDDILAWLSRAGK